METAATATVTCQICEKVFTCPPQHAIRREVCADDQCRKEAKKRKYRNPQIEFMTAKEVRQFLKAARQVGIGYYLAFRLAINGMLKVRDLTKLKATSLQIYRAEKDAAKPCVLKVGNTKVELDCETLAAVEEWHGQRKERLFPYHWLAIWRAFKSALKIGNVYEYTFHALRHTGIMLRAQCVKNLMDLEALRKAARFHSLKGLKPYLTAVDSPLVSRVHFAK